MKPVFAIVTPSYNQAEFIAETIESVIAQRHVDIEYVVMDGKSSDDTVRVLKKFKKKFIWQSKKDKGQTDAINKGYKILKKRVDPETAIFAYINSDDYYVDDRVFNKVAKAFAANSDKQWLTGDYSIYTQTAGWFHNILVRSWKKVLKLFYSTPLLLIANPIAQPATFIRMSAMEKVGLFDDKLRYVMDYEYWLRLQREFGNPIFLSEPLAYFRIHQTSKGGSQYEKQFVEGYEVAKEFTSNAGLLALHKLHNALTLLGYKFSK